MSSITQATAATQLGTSVAVIARMQTLGQLPTYAGGNTESEVVDRILDSQPKHVQAKRLRTHTHA
jgi:hypothetical protein